MSPTHTCKLSRQHGNQVFLRSYASLICWMLLFALMPYVCPSVHLRVCLSVLSVSFCLSICRVVGGEICSCTTLFLYDSLFVYLSLSLCVCLFISQTKTLIRGPCLPGPCPPGAYLSGPYQSEICWGGFIFGPNFPIPDLRIRLQDPSAGQNPNPRSKAAYLFNQDRENSFFTLQIYALFVFCLFLGLPWSNLYGTKRAWILLAPRPFLNGSDPPQKQPEN